MLIRRAPSGKHLIIWFLVLLVLALVVVLGSVILWALVRHPALGVL